MCKKKIAYSVIGVLVVAGVLSPWVTGMFLQHDLKKVIATAKLPAGMTVKLTNYRRGFFSSTATLEVTTNPNEGLGSVASLAADNNKPMTFVEKMHIFHGPLTYISTPIANQSGFYIGEGAVAIAIKQPITIHAIGKFDFFNHVKVAFVTDKVQLTSAPDNSITIGSITGLLKMKGQDHLKGKITLPELSINNPQWKASFDNASYRMDLSSGKDQLFFGNSELHVAELKAQSPSSGLVTFNKIEIKNNAMLEDNTVHYTLGLNINQFTNSTQKPFGPVDVKLSFAHLNPALLGQLQQTAQSLHDNKITQQQFSGQVLQLSLNLLSGAAIDLKPAVVKTPDGPINFETQISLPKVELLTSVSPLSLQPFMVNLAKGATFHMDIAVPATILKELVAHSDDEQSQATLDSWQKQGYVKQEDGQWHSTIIYAKGRWQANGEKVAIPLPIE